MDITRAEFLTCYLSFQMFVQQFQNISIYYTVSSDVFSRFTVLLCLYVYYIFGPWKGSLIATTVVLVVVAGSVVTHF